MYIVSKTRNVSILPHQSKVDLLIPGAGGNDPRGTTHEEFLGSCQLSENYQGFFDLDLSGFRHVFDLNLL